MSHIETERLILRTWMLPRDLDDAAELYGDPDTMNHTHSGAVDRVTAERIVTNFIDLDERQGFCPWPIVVKETRELVGACGLTYVPGTSDVCIAWVLKQIGRAHV